MHPEGKKIPFFSGVPSTVEWLELYKLIMNTNYLLCRKPGLRTWAKLSKTQARTCPGSRSTSRRFLGAECADLSKIPIPLLTLPLLFQASQGS